MTNLCVHNLCVLGYCKLNIMRICQPSDRATLEFRQFPGGDFNQPLLIWGWVAGPLVMVADVNAWLVGLVG